MASGRARSSPTRRAGPRSSIPRSCSPTSASDGCGREPDDDAWISWSKGPVVAELPPDSTSSATATRCLPRWWRMAHAGRLRSGRRDRDRTVVPLARPPRLGLRKHRRSALDLRDRSRLDRCALGVPAAFRAGRPARHRVVCLGRRRAALTRRTASAPTGTGFSRPTPGDGYYGPSYYAPSFFRDADGRRASRSGCAASRIPNRDGRARTAFHMCCVSTARG